MTNFLQEVRTTNEASWVVPCRDYIDRTAYIISGPMAHPNKSKMAAAAIFNFGNMSITLDWIKISCKKLYGKMHHGHAEVTT